MAAIIKNKKWKNPNNFLSLLLWLSIPLQHMNQGDCWKILKIKKLEDSHYKAKGILTKNFLHDTTEGMENITHLVNT